jgi:glycosyltransferase EpsE
MTLPPIAVLMPVHNMVGHVGRAVASIIDQTAGHWELLIVDDASTDGTWEIVQALARRDQRIVVTRNPERRGLASCLNLGWHATRHGLIARMDGDDESLPSRLARQVPFMVEHPDVAILGAAAELMDESGAPLGIALRPEWHEDLARNMYRQNPFIHPSVVMRRAVLERLGGYDETLRGAEDADLWLRAYRTFRFHNLQEPLIRYRVRRALQPAKAWSGAYVLTRAAYREGRLLTHGWYAARFLLGAIAGRAGLLARPPA